MGSFATGKGLKLAAWGLFVVVSGANLALLMGAIR
jgi:hypothetical protein